jgi:uncharacterized delta-60 repeat protein
MKTSLKCFASLCLLVFSAISVQAQLDTTFGNGGSVIASQQFGYPYKVIQIPNGKVAVLTTTADDVNATSYVIQYNSNGTLDTTFGTNGAKQIADPSLPNRNFYSLDFALQPDGKIVVGGRYFESGMQIHGFITRLNTNGTIDTTFASNGFQYPVMTQTGGDRVEYLTILPDGKIVAAGNSNFMGEVFFLQYLTSGNLDTSFNGQGFLFAASTGFTDSFFRLSNGKFILKANGQILRMNANGTLDSTFSRITLFTTRIFHAVATNDKIYLVENEQIEYRNGCQAHISSTDEMKVSAYTANGTLDTSFGLNGISKFKIVGFYGGYPNSITTDSNGQIYVGLKTQIYKRTRSLMSEGVKFAVAKINSSGNVTGRFISPNYNFQGITNTSNYGLINVGNDGKIVTAATNETSVSSPNYQIQRLTGVPQKNYNARIFPYTQDNFNGLALPLVYRPSAGSWHHYNSITNILGVSTDIPIETEYTFDRRFDVVYRPSTGDWTSRDNQGFGCTLNWGISGDIPLPGDFDGDSLSDFTVFRPSNGTWYIKNSQSNTNSYFNLGAVGDKPVAGDYDGDAIDDVAVFRPSTGVWYIRNSSTGGYTILQFGLNGDIPVQEDYDGDGKFDISVFRPSDGNWYRLNSSTGAFVVNHWGISTDIPVPADYDGDGKIDLAVYRGGIWYIFKSTDSAMLVYSYGLSTDIPLQRRQ